MCSSDVIVYVTNRQVNRPVLVVTCADGYCSFVAAENDRAKNGTMRLRILRNDVLKVNNISLQFHQKTTAVTYCLFPGP
jgi:hypothetical protein